MISKVKPDIVHAHDLICLPTARQVSKICKIPYIYDAHEFEVHRNPPLPMFQKLYVFFIETTYSLKASYVITVGKYIARGLAWRISPKKIKVLYNSPVINKSPYSLRKDLRTTNNKKILLYVGKVALGRGVEDVIRILPTLPSDIIFATVGPCDPRQKEKLIEIATKFEVNSRFTILPPVPNDNVVEYIKEADLGIISVDPVTLSYKYAMPNKLFELTFANVPIISNDLIEIEEFLAEHENGLVCDTKDDISLTYYISRVIKYKKEFIMSEEVYENLRKKYSWDSQLEKLFSMYNNALIK